MEGVTKEYEGFHWTKLHVRAFACGIGALVFIPAATGFLSLGLCVISLALGSIPGLDPVYL